MPYWRLNERWILKGKKTNGPGCLGRDEKNLPNRRISCILGRAVWAVQQLDACNFWLYFFLVLTNCKWIWERCEDMCLFLHNYHMWKHLIEISYSLLDLICHFCFYFLLKRFQLFILFVSHLLCPIQKKGKVSVVQVARAYLHIWNKNPGAAEENPCYSNSMAKWNNTHAQQPRDV